VNEQCFNKTVKNGKQCVDDIYEKLPSKIKKYVDECTENYDNLKLGKYITFLIIYIFLNR
jgi:hypothetical protein